MTLDPETIASNYDKYRSLVEKIGDRAEPALALVDGKLEVTVDNEMFDFTPDELRSAMSKPRWTVNSDGYDDDEQTGASIMRASRGEDPTIAVFNKEKRTAVRTIDYEKLKDIMKEL